MLVPLLRPVFREIACLRQLLPAAEPDLSCGAVARWPAYEGPSCPRCGAFLGFTGPQPSVPCLSCARRPPAYAAARSLFAYAGEVRAAIVAAKYAGRPFPARAVSERLEEALRGPWKDLLPDGERTTVVPVPVHPWKYLRRGFHLPSLIGSRLSNALGASFEPLLLLRDRERSPQAGLPLAKRPGNVRGAFRVPEGRAPAGRILLVDDVYTSGATAESCAHALKSRGADPIVVVTVARTVA